MLIGLMVGSLALVLAQDADPVQQVPGVQRELLALPAAWGSVTGFEAQSAVGGWCLVQATAERGTALVRWQVVGTEVQELSRWSLPETCTDLALGPQRVMLLGASALWSLSRDAAAEATPEREVDLPSGVQGDLWYSPSGARGLGDWLLRGEGGLHAWRRGAQGWSALGAEYAGMGGLLETQRGGLFLFTVDGPVPILPGAVRFPAPVYAAATRATQGVQLLHEAWPEKLRGRQLWLQRDPAEVRSYEVILRGTSGLSLDESVWLSLTDGPLAPDSMALAENGAALFLLQMGPGEWLRLAPPQLPVEPLSGPRSLADLDSSRVLLRRAAQAWFADTRAGSKRLDALRPAVASERLRFSEAPGMNFRPWMGTLGTDLGRLHTVWALSAWRSAADPRLVVRARLLVERAAASVDPGMRVAALDVLATWPGELEDPDQLLLLVNDGHAGVRQAAARAISMRALQEGGAALVKALSTEGDAGAAAQMAGALRELGSWSWIAEGATRLIMEAQRARLWELFEGVCDLRAIEPLAWTARDSSANFRVRAEAARVLGSLGSVPSERGEVAWEGTELVRQALARAVEQDQAPHVCEVAAGALAALEERLARD